MRRSVALQAFGIAFLSAVSVTALGFAPPQGVASKSSNEPSPFKNWGLINSRAKSHIQALDAWKLEQGSRSIKVAVIDTGLDSLHKDLVQNVWHDDSPDGQKAYGWNFVADEANPRDEHGHGTHVAGIIGAIADPSAGIGGVAQKVSIMAVKYYAEGAPGSVNLRNTVKAIEYAVRKGARIINYSGGGPEFSEEEYLAIKKAEAAGVLFVAAAGNEHQDTDLVENYYYPSAYRLSNIISVAATDIQNNLLKSSNWGKKKVDVAAPGENIYSTLPAGRYGYMSGTSQATAFVSGMAALLLARDPTLTPSQLREIIMTSVDRLPQLESRVSTGGRVNAYSALLAQRNKGQFSPNGPGILAGNPVSLLTPFEQPLEQPQTATR